ncbi:hypothetical protein GCM10009839_16070 [Catenulispora yoronensis]|uniref:Uncharacterized protein n=1 Tax=Catenulispora yoronensis TaxID=450799 RepID=A0ABP5FBM8_9ACTN
MLVDAGAEEEPPEMVRCAVPPGLGAVAFAGEIIPAAAATEVASVAVSASGRRAEESDMSVFAPRPVGRRGA